MDTSLALLILTLISLYFLDRKSDEHSASFRCPTESYPTPDRVPNRTIDLGPWQVQHDRSTIVFGRCSAWKLDAVMDMRRFDYYTLVRNVLGVTILVPTNMCGEPCLVGTTLSEIRKSTDSAVRLLESDVYDALGCPQCREWTDDLVINVYNTNTEAFLLYAIAMFCGGHVGISLLQKTDLATRRVAKRVWEETRVCKKRVVRKKD